jgi:isoleucyl-tRNA synthetase
VTYANLDGFNFQTVDYRENSDVWILESLKQTVSVVTDSLNAFNTHVAASAIQSFVENLSNWYVRLNRHRFWQKEMDDSKISAYQTLHKCLLDLSVILAPFTPFLAEDIFQNLKNSDVESVHLADWISTETFSKELLQDMDAVVDLISAGRAARVNAAIKTKQPIKEVTFVTQFNLDGYAALIKEELNCLTVHLQGDSNLTQKIFKANFKNLGYRGFGKKAQELKVYLESLSTEDMNNLTFPKEVDGFVYTEDDVLLSFKALPGHSAVSCRSGLVIINTEENEELIFEGVFRELKSLIQKERKSSGMEINSRVNLDIHVDEKYKDFFSKNRDRLLNDILISKLALVNMEANIMINDMYFGFRVY